MCKNAETPAGTLTASFTGDTVYPGILIRLKRGDKELTLGLIEYDSQEDCLRGYLWGDGINDEPTQNVRFLNVNEYFAEIE